MLRFTSNNLKSAKSRATFEKASQLYIEKINHKLWRERESKKNTFLFC